MISDIEKFAKTVKENLPKAKGKQRYCRCPCTKTWILRTRISSPGHQCPVGLHHGKIQRMKKVGLRGSVSHQTGPDAVCRKAPLARQRSVAVGGGAGVLEQTGLEES